MATRIDSRDLKKAGEFIKEEAETRQKDRKDREKQWQEVDDQLKMSEDLTRKIRAKRTDGEGDWVPAMVLPHQSTALEVLTSDARRMMLPQNLNWFECHADMTDDVLEDLESNDLIGVKGRQMLGDKVDQEELDAICDAVLEHNHKKYDVGRAIDLLNADALKYGEFAGRMREVKGKIFSEDFRGVFENERKFVAMVPSNMKNTYPDESVMHVMGEGLAIQPSWVRVYSQRIQDIKIAASKSSADPGDMMGGWMKKAVSGLEPETKGKRNVKVIEYEGDLVIPRSQSSVQIFNRIITVAVGKDVRVIRIREQKQPFRSYIHGVYHFEGGSQKVGPLMKAAPLHNAMSEIFNRLIASGIINVEPPISWPADDRFMMSEGGPRIYPRASWQTTGTVTPQPVGDPQALLEMFLVLLRMYEELTGVNSPRTGAQTKSHQTAFAIDTEQSRSQIRTVDYVQSALRGPFTNWLHMEWEMIRKTMGKERVYVPKLGGYIEISGRQLPNVWIEVHGAAGPIEEQREQQTRMQSLTGVLQAEQLSQQLGGKPIDVDRLREEFLRNGGWSDPQRFFKEPVSTGADPAAEAVPGGIDPEQLLAAVNQ